MTSRTIIQLYLIIVLVVSGCQKSDVVKLPKNKLDTRTPAFEPAKTDDANELFDGKTLTNWKPTNFGGEGEVAVVDGIIQLETGHPMTGVTWDGDDLPKTDYEISIDAKRIQGGDFFCGLTFPVAESHCSLIVGGWGGTLIGLSSIDDFDASENRTTQFHDFEDDRWYKFRIRVKTDSITVWMDDKEVIHHPLEGHTVSIRNETLPCRPLGVCSFETEAGLRNITLRKLSAQPTDK